MAERAIRRGSWAKEACSQRLVRLFIRLLRPSAAYLGRINWVLRGSLGPPNADGNILSWQSNVPKYLIHDKIQRIQKTMESSRLTRYYVYFLLVTDRSIRTSNHI